MAYFCVPDDAAENDCVYSPYPLFHVGAAQYDVLPAMMVGGRAVIRDGFSLSNFWREVCQYEATWFMALGSVQPLLWAQAPTPEETAHKMRFFWGTPLPVDHDAFEARFKLKVARGGGYGSTDAGSVALPMWDKAGAGIVLDRYEVAIVDSVVHPNYSDDRYDHDVMLFLIEEETPHPYIKPRKEEVTEGMLTVLGFGSTQQIGPHLSSTLQEVELEYLDNARCDEGHGGNGDITDDMMCAWERQKDSCIGDR